METDGIMLDSVVSDNRKQELALKLSKVPASFNVSLRTSSDVVYMEDALLELAKNFTGEGRYMCTDMEGSRAVRQIYQRHFR